MKRAPSVNSREPDHDRAREVALDGLILRGLVGSTVHGLANPGTDDRDEMGVCVEPPEYVIGLREFDHYVFRTKPEGVPSGPGDLDLTVYGLRKFCRLALKGSPTVLLLFFIEGEHRATCPRPATTGASIASSPTPIAPPGAEGGRRRIGTGLAA